ncbi:hypothetical protein Tco_1374821 [Tanacetum coccineum]
MVFNSPCLTNKKELAIPGQTAIGKESSNLLMADSLTKTILCWFNSTMLLEAFEGPDGPVYWEDTQSQVAGQAGVGHWPLALWPFVLLDPRTKIHAQVSVESEG